jgi:hypothetical protein
MTSGRALLRGAVGLASLTALLAGLLTVVASASDHPAPAHRPAVGGCAYARAHAGLGTGMVNCVTFDHVQRVFGPEPRTP